MATIRARGDKWQVIVRTGKYKFKPISKSFTKKTVAESWAKKIESQIDEGVYTDGRGNKDLPIHDLLQRYFDEANESASKNTIDNRTSILTRLQKDFKKHSLHSCNSQVLYDYFVNRRKVVKADTVIKDITFFTGMFRRAKIIWKLPIGDNPAKEARSMMSEMGLLDGANLQHDRRLTELEYISIRRYQMKKFGHSKYAALFLIETGMRRGELCVMQWARINFRDSVYHLESQKADNKRSRVAKGRDVPLTNRAKAILRLIRYMAPKKGQPLNDFVWPWRDPRSCSRGIKRIYKSLGIDDLRIHDLRHDFGSIQTDSGTDMRIVAAAMGHSDFRSMKRYAHPDMKKVAGKLATR
jgi:integrase